MSRCRLGPFTFDQLTGDLHGPSGVRRVPPQPARLLTLLLQRPGECLTRDEIAASLWNDAVHVDVDAGIAFAVRQLRVLLGDDAASPQFIETVPKRGYRLVSGVERPEPREVHVEAPAGRQRRTSRLWVFALGAAAALASVAAVAMTQGQSGVIRVVVQVRIDPASAAAMNIPPLADVVVDRLHAEAPPGLVVVAPQAAAPYLHRPVADLRRDLGADVLLHVAILTVDGRFVLHTKLVRLSDSVLLWSANREVDPSALGARYRSVGEDIARAAIGILSN